MLVYILSHSKTLLFRKFLRDFPQWGMYEKQSRALGHMDGNCEGNGRVTSTWWTQPWSWSELAQVAFAQIFIEELPFRFYSEGILLILFLPLEFLSAQNTILKFQMKHLPESLTLQLTFISFPLALQVSAVRWPNQERDPPPTPAQIWYLGFSLGLSGMYQNPKPMYWPTLLGTDTRSRITLSLTVKCTVLFSCSQRITLSFLGLFVIENPFPIGIWSSLPCFKFLRWVETISKVKLYEIAKYQLFFFFFNLKEGRRGGRKA